MESIASTNVDTSAPKPYKDWNLERGPLLESYEGFELSLM